MYKKGALSILQIVILILGIIAISYAIGSEMRIVSGTSNWYDELIKRGASEVDGGLFTPDGRYLGEGDILKKTEYIPKTGTPSTTVKPTDGSSMLSNTLGIKAAPKGKSSEFISLQTGGFVDAILSGAQWAGIAYLAVQFLGPIFGLSDAETQAASNAAI